MSEHDTTALSTLSGAGPQVAPAAHAAPNPLHLVQDRLQNRWRLCLALGGGLGVALGVAAYMLAPVKYAATAYVKIDAKLDTILDEDMPETAAMDNYEAYVAQQVVLINDPRVFEAVADAARRSEPTARATTERPAEAAAEFAAVRRFFERYGPEEGVRMLDEGLVVGSPRGSSMIEIRFESPDKSVPAPMANWVTDAYLDTYGPSAETIYSRKIASLRELMTAARRDAAKYMEERIAVLKDTPYGSANLGAVVEEKVAKMRAIEDKILANTTLQRDIERQWEEMELRAGTGAGSPRPVPDDMRLEPTLSELDAIDASLVERRRSLESARVRFQALPRTYLPEHRIYKTAAREVEDLQAQLDAARQSARTMWAEGTGRDLSYAALRRQESRLTEERATLRTEIDQANMLMARLTESDRRVSEARAAEQSFGTRIAELEREQDSIRRGRVGIARYASQLPTPDSDKRAQFAALGLIGGLGLSFAAFFVIGTISPRAFRASQLVGEAQGLHWLGVVPDMSNASTDGFVHELAINCIDRLRNKVEARRTPGDGYAMMVTSPSQGDGKTTIALALAISYARAGHRTVIVDCDFIGRAMSGMLDQLNAPGVREVIRRGTLDNELVEAQPGVWLLPIGLDPNISASNLQVGAMRRLLRTLRDRFDIIIVDGGPVTASVEAIPVAASCDGAMLVLRRGRTRTRLPESVGEIRSAGAEYLGLVLNDAEQADCIRYGSISRMSTEVAAAIERGDAGVRTHPLLGAGRIVPRGGVGGVKGAA
jgi:receptor protein-tyrosine kinase